MKRFAAWPAWAFMLVFFALPLLALLPESLSDGGTAFGRVIGDNLFFAAMRNTILLAAVSGVYYWRAKTEEKHLLGDPAYQAYWAWAQRHALVPRLFAKLSGRALPRIRLDPDPRVGPVA